ncbi:MAG: phosphodiester glycosidase family protein [Armatimonadota bacterium]
MRYIIRRKNVFLNGLMLFAIVLASPSVFAHSDSITYQKRWAAGIPVHLVTVNLNDVDVRMSPVLPRYGVGHSELWSTMIGRARPTAAITGTYFDTRSLYPTGDIMVDGDFACRGVVGTAIGFGWNNEVLFVPTKRGRISDWSAFQHILVGGPVLVWNGKLSVNPRAQGFRDSSLFAKRQRTAIGVNKRGKLLLAAVTRPVYLRKIARAMRELGAINAAALDGGSSTALYYRGRSIVKPSRRLTNLLAAYDDPVRHSEVRYLLAPATNRYIEQPESTER